MHFNLSVQSCASILTCCRSPEWYEVPDKVKQDIGMQVLEEGEFWLVYGVITCKASFRSFDVTFICCSPCFKNFNSHISFVKVWAGSIFVFFFVNRWLR